MASRALRPRCRRTGRLRARTCLTRRPDFRVPHARSTAPIVAADSQRGDEAVRRIREGLSGPRRDPGVLVTAIVGPEQDLVLARRITQAARQPSVDGFPSDQTEVCTDLDLELLEQKGRR
jgi:hypothetical protein